MAHVNIQTKYIKNLKSEKERHIKDIEELMEREYRSAMKKNM